MGIVRGCHEGGEARAVFLRTAIDGTAVDLTLRESLLQRRMLTGTDSLQFIEVDQEVVCQRHLLVKLVGEVHVVKEVLTQMRREQAHDKGGLATPLRTNQRGNALVAMQGVHLEPVGYHRAQPDNEETMLLRADAGQSAEETGNVVLSVPLGQMFQIVANGIEYRHLF